MTAVRERHDVEERTGETDERSDSFDVTTDPGWAAEAGLVDRLVEGELLPHAVAFAEEVRDIRPLTKSSDRQDRVDEADAHERDHAGERDGPHRARLPERSSLHTGAHGRHLPKSLASLTI